MILITIHIRIEEFTIGICIGTEECTMGIGIRIEECTTGIDLKYFQDALQNSSHSKCSSE